MCSPASFRNGSGIQLRWGKASPRHGDCNGGVRTTDGASYVTGHGARRLDHNRRAGMVRVQRHWPVLWCVWASQCSSGHVGQVEGSSRASGGFGHGGGLPITSAASVWGLWPRRGITVGSVGSYGSVWTWRGHPELKARLPVSRWPVGSSRRPWRHGDDGEARGSLQALAGWSQRARELPVASVNGTGESRRRQALLAVLATAVGARTSGRVLRPVV